MSMQEVRIIRQALLNEQEAIDFYQMAAQQAKSAEARDAFNQLAAEEKKHVEWLLALYRSIRDNNLDAFDATAFEEPAAPVQYDWAAVGRESGSLAVSVFGIGINLEKTAIDFYTRAALETDLPAAKALYEVLVRWEYQHLEQFQQEYDALREEWWDKQGFTPS